MIAPRNAAALASIFVLCAAIGCTNFYEIPIETPIQPKMDVSMFQRVLIAGFIAGGSDDVDANLETVRLLRSWLRNRRTVSMFASTSSFAPAIKPAMKIRWNGVTSSLGEIGVSIGISV